MYEKMKAEMMAGSEIKATGYFSTNLSAPKVSFEEALLRGLAPDKGLYMPERIPTIDEQQKAAFHGMAYYEIAAHVLSAFLGETIPFADLTAMCRDAYTFDVPLEPAGDNLFILRLDQGPTASFKDFAARLMARMMNYFMAKEKRHLVILTATSGDTGSAVANAFYGLEHIDVVVLFPLREVSEVQRRQMTTLHGNVHIAGIDGKFDHCQALVKQAFTDQDLARIPLSSANSINIGRLLPQTVYYWYAASRVCSRPGSPVIFSVPSGNFGNLMGGVLARETGLPVQRFIVATNANKEVPEYLRTGVYQIISPSLMCLSSAMNVGHPSNMARLVALYGGVMDEKGNILRQPDLQRMRNDFLGVSVTDEETMQTMTSVWKEKGIILEPHGAVAWKGSMEYLHKNNTHAKDIPVVVIETAHPGKFPDEVKEATGTLPILPEPLKKIFDKDEQFDELENQYPAFKNYLLKMFS